MLRKKKRTQRGNKLEKSGNTLMLNPRQKRTIEEYGRYSGKTTEQIVSEAVDSFIEGSLGPRLSFYRKAEKVRK